VTGVGIVAALRLPRASAVSAHVPGGARVAIVAVHHLLPGNPGTVVKPRYALQALVVRIDSEFIIVLAIDKAAAAELVLALSGHAQVLCAAIAVALARLAFFGRMRALAQAVTVVGGALVLVIALYGFDNTLPGLTGIIHGTPVSVITLGSGIRKFHLAFARLGNADRGAAFIVQAGVAHHRAARFYLALAVLAVKRAVAQVPVLLCLTVGIALALAYILENALPCLAVSIDVTGVGILAHGSVGCGGPVYLLFAGLTDETGRHGAGLAIVVALAVDVAKAFDNVVMIALALDALVHGAVEVVQKAERTIRHRLEHTITGLAIAGILGAYIAVIAPFFGPRLALAAQAGIPHRARVTVFARSEIGRLELAIAAPGQAIGFHALGILVRRAFHDRILVDLAFVVHALDDAVARVVVVVLLAVNVILALAQVLPARALPAKAGRVLGTRIPIVAGNAVEHLLLAVPPLANRLHAKIGRLLADHDRILVNLALGIDARVLALAPVAVYPQVPVVGLVAILVRLTRTVKGQLAHALAGLTMVVDGARFPVVAVRPAVLPQPLVEFRTILARVVDG